MVSIGAAHLIRLDRVWPVHLAFVLVGTVLIAVLARAQWRREASVSASRRDTVRLVLGVILAVALGTTIQVALLAWFDRD